MKTLNMPNKTLLFLWFFIKKNIAAFTMLAVTSLIWAINQNAFPIFLKFMINTFESSKNLNRLSIYLCALLAEVAFLIISMRIQGILITKAIPSIGAKIKTQLIALLLSYKHEYFSEHQSGTIISKISSIASSIEKITQIILFNFISTISALFFAIFITAYVSKAISCIFIIWAALHFATTFLFLRNTNKKLAVHKTVHIMTTDSLSDFVANIKNIKLSNNTDDEFNKLRKSFIHEASSFKRIMVNIEIMKLALSFIGSIFICSIIALLIHLTKTHQISSGDFAMVLMLSFGMLTFVWQMSFHISNYLRELPIIQSALNLLIQPHNYNHQENKSNLTLTHPQIAIKNLSYYYPFGKKALQNISLTINSGEKIRIKGQSGSGKTTLISTIVRLINDIGTDCIFIDNKDITTLSSESLYKHITFVSQDPILFNRSIYENIKFGNPTASDSDVYKAAITACCDDFINHFSLKYDTIVGEKGSKLSGGQRQRILLARAFLRNTEIIILDEPTSSLDPNTEIQIFEHISKHLPDKTIIVVLHNDHLDNYFDQIIEIHNGSIKSILKKQKPLSDMSNQKLMVGGLS